MACAPEVVREPPLAAVAGLIQEIVETSLDGAENAIVCPAVGTLLGSRNVKSAVRASGTSHFLKFAPFAGSSDNVNAPAAAPVVESSSDQVFVAVQV
jgi:hypothetical protein